MQLVKLWMLLAKENVQFTHAKVPLLNHHTSGVRMEWYRDDLEEHTSRDPLTKLKELLLKNDFSEAELSEISKKFKKIVLDDYNKAIKEKDPKLNELHHHILAPTNFKESGVRAPKEKDATVMVDSALFAIREILESDLRCLLYGCWGKAWGVFREAAT